jgi:ABC-type polysaccharide/polyol phosphate transport system ATPase subunit
MKCQLDIEGLNITVTSSSGNPGSKSKAKARAEGLEILTNASLKLKAGIHYALIGRNGTGKSSKFSHATMHSNDGSSIGKSPLR